MATLRLVPGTGNPIEVSQDSALVGREPSCDIVLPDGSVSRKHARFERRGATWYVIDQGSANGTYLDSQRVGETSLRDGQELRFGAVSFKVAISGEEAGATVLTEMEPGETVLQPAAQGAPPAASPTRPAAALPPPPGRPVAPPPPPAPASAARVMPAPAAGSQGPLVPKPVKKGRSPWVWVTAGCCGCLVVIALGFGALVGLPIFLTRGAVTCAREHIAEIARGDQQAAYNRLSQNLKSQLSVDDFVALVASHPALRDNKDARLVTRMRDSEATRLVFVLTGSGGEQETVQYTLAQESGEWRITGMEFSSSPPSP